MPHPLRSWGSRAQGRWSEQDLCSVSSTWCPCSPLPIPLHVLPTEVGLLGPPAQPVFPWVSAGPTLFPPSLVSPDSSCFPSLLSLSTVSSCGRSRRPLPTLPTVWDRHPLGVIL